MSHCVCGIRDAHTPPPPPHVLWVVTSPTHQPGLGPAAALPSTASRTRLATAKGGVKSRQVFEDVGTPLSPLWSGPVGQGPCRVPREEQRWPWVPPAQPGTLLGLGGGGGEQHVNQPGGLKLGCERHLFAEGQRKLAQGWKGHHHPHFPEGLLGAWPGGRVGFQVTCLLCLSPGRAEEAVGTAPRAARTARRPGWA